jgi:alpha-ribazole phosphatase
MRVALVRHLAPLIEPGICYGRLDVRMTPSAEGQIGKLATDPAFHGAARVWTSPAVRCRVIADAIALALGVPFTIEPRLQELDFGEWEGKSWEAIGRADLDRWAASPLTFASPGGESGAELIARISDFHADLFNDQQDCVIVSHGGPLKLLSALLLGTPVDLLAPAPPIGSVLICLADQRAHDPSGRNPGGGIRETTPLRKDCGLSRHGMIPSSVDP